MTALQYGPYVTTSTLGRGGMGVVYRARHERTQQAVALKTVRVQSAQLMALFRREVHVLANLRHAGVVRIIEHGFTDDTPWYAMELIEGRPLSTLLEGSATTGTAGVVGTATTEVARAPVLVDVSLGVRQALPAHVELWRQDRARCIGIFRDVCRTLSFVHAQGLVHRDLKPDNVVLRADGRPVLVDFGLAASFGGNAGRERLLFSGPLGGTFAYMAPEQRLGRFVDARADLFSLGCMLYEALTGELPFGPSGLFDFFQPAPRPPGALAADIPAELDQLVMRLLLAQPTERLGYANDVEDALARLESSATAPRIDASPAYLYRPDFAGREAALEPLARLLGEAKSGKGGRALIAGESGVGKTRLLLELAARADEQEMLIVTGECQPVGMRGEALAAPLHPLRGLLQAAVDLCSGGGALMTQRLLAGRGKVLSPYEPVLGTLVGDAAEPEALPAEAARKRLFSALKGLLADVARERPCLLVLDDLQWADELSLEFLCSLTPQDHAEMQLLLVGSYRSEEIGERLRGLADDDWSLKLELGRLEPDAAGRMVAGMLALQAPSPSLIELLLRESRGNPFFIAEYLRVAIAEGLLDRDAAGRWTLRVAEDALGEREVAVPATVGALIERRLQGLDAACLRALHGAAVLGRGFDVELVARIAGLAVAEVLDAYGVLRQRQILEDDASGGSRFVHDKLRELSYSRIPEPALTELHGRAVEALEGRSEQELEGELGALGYHSARAGLSAKGADYFERAAERALRGYANADAMRYFRQALEQLAKLEGVEALALGRVQEALGDVLLLSGQPEAARQAFAAALGSAGPGLLGVRRRRKLARTWEREHRHAEALVEYESAELELGDSPRGSMSEEEWWQERVQIQVDKAWDLYWLARVDELSALVERVRPFVEQRGEPRQRAQFFQALVHTNLRRDRYGISEDTVEYARASLAAAELGSDLSQLALARFFLAFPLMFRGREAEAEPLFQAALTDAERVGDATLLARSLSYYAILHRRLGRIEAARATAERAGRVAERGVMHDYVGASQANLCWVAWRQARTAEGEEQRAALVEQHARAAFAAWSRLPAAYPYPFQWYVRLPYGAFLAERGQLEDALIEWLFLLGAGQQALPVELGAAIEHFREETRAELASRVIALAQELRYL